MDFALLHILNTNPWLFRSTDDNEPFKALARLLPERHLGTNIKMLRLEDEERIAEHFAADNIAVLDEVLRVDGRGSRRNIQRLFPSARRRSRVLGCKRD